MTANFTLSGTAWDTNSIASIEVKDDGKTGVWTHDFTDTEKAAAKSAPPEDDENHDNWRCNFIQA